MARLSSSLLFRALAILTVMGFFLLLFIILKFGFITPKLKPAPESTCQKLASTELKYNSAAAENFRDLAELCVENGEHEEALQILSQVYKVQSWLFGPKNREAVETLGILAGEHVVLKNHDEGLALYWRVYKIKEEILGPTHSETLTALQTLAHVYHFKGKYEKAVGFLKVIYKQRKILLGPEDLKTMESLLLLASSLEKSNQSPETIEKVLKYYGKVYKVYSRIWGENDNTLSVLSAVGKCLVSLKQLDEAVPIFERIMQAMEKRPQSELYEDAEKALSLSLMQLGRTQEARLVHVKARRNKNKKGTEIPEYASKVLVHGKLTPEVEDQVNGILHLARVAMAEENFEKALLNLEEVYSIIEKDHPRTHEIFQGIISVHGALRNVKRAFEMSIQLFHEVQKHSNQNKNEQIADAWQLVFSSYLKLMEEHSTDEIEQHFNAKIKEISEIALNALGIKEIDENSPNPTILRTLAIAGFLCEKPEVALPAASKLIPILERQRDAEPKSSEEEIEKFDKEIKVFQKQLEEHQSCGRGGNFEIQNDMHRNEL